MSNKLQELFEARAKCLHDMREVSDKYKGSDPFSAEDEESYDAWNRRYDELTVKIKTEENLLKREEEEKRVAVPRTIDTDKTPNTPEARKEHSQAEYRDAFNAYLRAPKYSPVPEMLAKRASTDPQSIGTDADGGYLAPDEFWRQLVETRDNANIMRGLATTIQTASGTLTIPKVDEHGVATYYAESAAIAVDKEDFTVATMTAYKCARIIKVTQELLNDSFFDFATYCFNELGRSIGVREEQAFVLGTGSAQPTGIFTGATTGVTAASATAVTSDELIDLYHSVARPYRPNGTWMMKDATAKLIRKLKDGDQQYLWQPGLKAGQPDILFGRPVAITDYAPAATTGLDAILFGDVRAAYWIADRVGLSLQRLDELYAVNDQVGFKGTVRHDAKIIDAAAVRVLTMG
jgi:HK97 family phage major capsid protein